MIRKFVRGGFKIPCFYCKTFNIVYPQDQDYMHALLEPCFYKDSVLSMFKCIASGPNTTGINAMRVTTEDNSDYRTRAKFDIC
jgi:hypothetical protein